MYKLLMQDFEVEKIDVTIKARQYHQKIIAQLGELPFITVHGNTMDEINDKILKQLTTYFKTFPENADKIFNSVGKKVNGDEANSVIEKAIEEGIWTIEKKKLLIPISK
jgi:inorganic pyrophosphatase